MLVASLKAPALVLALTMPACTYVAAVAQTNVPAHRGHPVQAVVSKFIFFGTFDNDEALTLPAKLRAKCPGGAVRGILTKDLRIWYFFNILMTQETTASGYCVDGQNKNMAERSERADMADADEVRDATAPALGEAL